MSHAPSSDRGRWLFTLLAICTLYPLGIAVATYPRVWHLGSDLPLSRVDSLQAITVMRWYKSCLLEGRSPLINSDIQYPVGAPIGNFSPMHLQSLLYIPLSSLFDDVTCYNILMNFGVFFTGVGTFALAWYLVRDRPAAVLGGFLAMMSCPVMGRAWCHLELTYVGFFPLFMIAWMRLVDRPNFGRLLAAAALYTLLIMSAVYYLVFSIFPAGLYAAWHGALAARRRDWAWLRSRTGWLSGFAALVGASALILFSGHLWAVTHGYSLGRSRWDFERYGAPLWGYFIPSPSFNLNRFLPFDFYTAAGIGLLTGERHSYLGVVTVLLLYYSASRRVAFRGARYWWTNLALLTLFSMGAICYFGEHKVELPGGWIWSHFFLFRLIRVPARFNAFVAVCAGCIAAAGLRDILSRVRYRSMKAVLSLGLVAFTLYDLTSGPIPSADVPPIPPCYTFVKRRDPRATLLEVPQVYPSIGSSLHVSTDGAYWQSFHGMQTSAGYSGQHNVKWDETLGYTSPFLETRLSNPNYPENPEKGCCIDLVCDVGFRDYTWLYLTTHGIRYIVLHHGSEYRDKFPPLYLDATKGLLRVASIFEDDRAVVYDRDLLPRPSRPTLLCTEGWRQRVAWRDRWVGHLAKTGRIAVYNPDPDRELQFAIEAVAAREPRRLRLRSGDAELARWDIPPDALRVYVSPKFRLPTGLQELTLESDGEVRMRAGHAPPPLGGDWRPISLRVATIRLVMPDPPGPPPAL
jgi:hypothetical protein